MDKYLPSKFCTWRITVPAGKRVKFAFTNFTLGSCSLPCSSDSCTYVEVYDGASTSSLFRGRSCHNSNQEEVSSGNLERFPFVWKNRLFRWEIKWNGPFHWNFFGKKGIPSEVFLFSRFSRNDRKISVPFATTSLFAHRARSTSDPKNAETYPFNRFKLIQNSCRV